VLAFDTGTAVVPALARKFLVTETGLKLADFFNEYGRVCSWPSPRSLTPLSPWSALLVSVSDSTLPSRPALLTDPSSAKSLP
jgi:hypothetical protein